MDCFIALWEQLQRMKPNYKLMQTTNNVQEFIRIMRSHGNAVKLTTTSIWKNLQFTVYSFSECAIPSFGV